MAPNLATRYLESMKHHPYGYAFYEPEAASEVRPGTCGYLNEFCQWQPIADLTDVNDLQKKGLTEPADLIAAKDSSHEWGPKLSHSVRSAKLNVNLGASGAAAGIPAEASVSYEFWSLLDHGAILYCPSKVFQQGYHYRHEFVQWAKANAKQLAKIRPEVKDDGFYVVTSTYTTDDIWINAWSEQGKKVAMGFKVSAVGAGEVAPSGEFFKAEGASGWTHATPEGTDQKVVFFSGLRFKYWSLPFGMTSIREVRGEDSVVIADPLNEADLYQLDFENIGTSED